MTIRLRDRAVLLEPATTLDEYTEARTADWAKPPRRRIPTPFHAFPISSTEETLTAETVISRWRGFLPVQVANPSNVLQPLVLAEIFTPSWRVEWDCETYLIEGNIAKNRGGGRTRHLTIVLKKVDD